MAFWHSLARLGLLLDTGPLSYGTDGNGRDYRSSTAFTLFVEEMMMTVQRQRGQPDVAAASSRLWPFGSLYMPH